MRDNNKKKKYAKEHDKSNTKHKYLQLSNCRFWLPIFKNKHLKTASI